MTKTTTATRNGRTITKHTTTTTVEITTKQITNENYFGYDIPNELMKGQGTIVNGFEFCYCNRSGAFSWVDEERCIFIYATPFFDGNNGIPILVVDNPEDDGIVYDTIEMSDDEISYDAKKDAQTYLRKMLPVLFAN